MEARLKRITEDTLLPLSVVALLFGFVSWLTTLYNETRDHTDQIIEIKADQRLYGQKIDRILEKLGHIEGQLEVQKSQQQRILRERD
jgi:hypothetical protein